MSRQQLMPMTSCLLALYLFSQTVYGQAEEKRANSTSSAKAIAASADIQPLKDVPELPKLPIYTGRSKFLRGYVQATGKGWTAYHLSFLLHEDPLKAQDWYKNALATYQWKILNSNGQTITANHDDGHMCTLIFNSYNKQGFHTRLGLFYSQAPQITPAQE